MIITAWNNSHIAHQSMKHLYIYFFYRSSHLIISSSTFVLDFGIANCYCRAIMISYGLQIQTLFPGLKSNLSILRPSSATSINLLTEESISKCLWTLQKLKTQNHLVLIKLSFGASVLVLMIRIIIFDTESLVSCADFRQRFSSISFDSLTFSSYLNS